MDPQQRLLLECLGLVHVPRLTGIAAEWHLPPPSMPSHFGVENCSKGEMGLKVPPKREGYIGYIPTLDVKQTMQ